MDTTEPITASGLARLGFMSGQVVQEFGWDDDVDNDLRFAVEDVVGSDLADEDYGDVADAALIWWRSGDGDLVDILVDALPNLADGGFLVLLAPKAGRHLPVVDVRAGGLSGGEEGKKEQHGSREKGA